LFCVSKSKFKSVFPLDLMLVNTNN
jgi:hypothetical protein